MNSDGGVRVASRENLERLVLGLGWLSIGLGLAEILAPRLLARLGGVQPRPRLMRFLGAREVASGIGILTRPDPTPWLQARVAGDSLDLGLLGAAWMSAKSQKGGLALATATVAGVTALDLAAARELSRRNEARRSESGVPATGMRVCKSVIIDRPAEELYRFWRQLEQLPSFMEHLVSVQVLDERRSHWVGRGPAGTRIEWEGEITEDQPNQLIAWRTIGSSDLDHSGRVRFEPAAGQRGTIVRVEMLYRVPAGRAGVQLMRLLGQSPERQIGVDLMRFKQRMETGEVARTEGQPTGRTRSAAGASGELMRG